MLLKLIKPSALIYLLFLFVVGCSESKKTFRSQNKDTVASPRVEEGGEKKSGEEEKITEYLEVAKLQGVYRTEESDGESLYLSLVYENGQLERKLIFLQKDQNSIDLDLRGTVILTDEKIPKGYMVSGSDLGEVESQVDMTFLDENKIQLTWLRQDEVLEKTVHKMEVIEGGELWLDLEFGKNQGTDVKIFGDLKELENKESCQHYYYNLCHNYDQLVAATTKDQLEGSNEGALVEDSLEKTTPPKELVNENQPGADSTTPSNVIAGSSSERVDEPIEEDTPTENDEGLGADLKRQESIEEGDKAEASIVKTIELEPLVEEPLIDEINYEKLDDFLIGEFSYPELTDQIEVDESQERVNLFFSNELDSGELSSIMDDMKNHFGEFKTLNLLSRSGDHSVIILIPSCIARPTPEELLNLRTDNTWNPFTSISYKPIKKLMPVFYWVDVDTEAPHTGITSFLDILTVTASDFSMSSRVQVKDKPAIEVEISVGGVGSELQTQVNNHIAEQLSNMEFCLN